MAAVLGFVSETGVAGLTLGGGFGYLTRRFGWTVDSLDEVEIVTADGEVRTANRDQERRPVLGPAGRRRQLRRRDPFTFRLHQVGPIVTGGLIAWSAEQADEVLAAYRDLTESAPRELTAAATIRLAPPAPFAPGGWHGKPIVAMVGVPQRRRTPRRTSPPSGPSASPSSMSSRTSPTSPNSRCSTPPSPRGSNDYWKTEFLPGLSDEFLDAFREGALGVQLPDVAVDHLPPRRRAQRARRRRRRGRQSRRPLHHRVHRSRGLPATPADRPCGLGAGLVGAHQALLHGRELRQLPTGRRRRTSGPPPPTGPAIGVSSASRPATTPTTCSGSTATSRPGPEGTLTTTPAAATATPASSLALSHRPVSTTA